PLRSRRHGSYPPHRASVMSSGTDSEYVHRLVNYDLGLIRRALIGEVYSRLTSVVHPATVKIEGIGAVLVAGALFAVVFRRAFPVSSFERFAAACFLFGSPLLFKNFVGNIAKLDVYGAVVALLAVLVPLSSLGLLIIAALSALLLLIHHIHATLYLPTIGAIFLLRAVAAGKSPRWHFILVAALCAALLVIEFLFLMFKAIPAVTREEFLAGLRFRSVQPLTDYASHMWYSTLADEMADTRSALPGHLVRFPIYIALIMLHWPIYRLLATRGRLAMQNSRYLSKAWLVSVIAVVGCYAIMLFVTYDYARYLGNLGFCLTLLWLAVMINASGVRPVPADQQLSGRTAMGCAAVVAVLPWTGTIFPLF
ncbi:hypothetical protein, partial [Phreatobacter oligotrophus]|uniref:hypothetical protein n=1 Tax=Phreatobacter oligotrophus TaxID=1122261 RepID=UPI0023555B52